MAELLSASELLQRYQAGDRNFRHYCLTGLDLREADLRQADFSQAELQGANFGDADLRAATFVGANLSGANFQGAIVAETDFTAANLEGTHGLSWQFAGTATNNLAGETAVSGEKKPTPWSVNQFPQATVGSKAAAATSFLDADRSRPGDRGNLAPDLVLTPQETQSLVRELRSLQRWRGVTTTIALILLFVAVLGGYLGYVKYREYEQLEARVTASEEARERELQDAKDELDILRQERQNLKVWESQFAELSAELDLAEQERQGLEAELESERRRGAENASQVSTLLESLREAESQLNETKSQLETERERVRQLTEINNLLQGRLESRIPPGILPTLSSP